MEIDNEFGRPEPMSGMVAASARHRLAFVQKVYGVFLLGIVSSLTASALLFAGPSAQLGSNRSGQDVVVPLLVMGVLKNYFAVVIAFFVLFFVARAVRRTPGLNLLALLAFTAVSGVMVTPRVWIATVTAPGTVPLAGALTTLMFVGLSAYAFFSRGDFNFLGAGLTVALLGLIGGGLLNAFFFQSPWAHMAMAWGALVIFSGFIVYDTARILRDSDTDDVVSAALELYLDVINLFLALLDILGGNRR
jgi:modulator of FtsH protease